MTRTEIITEVLKRMGRYTQLDTTLQANLIIHFNTICDEFPYLHEWWCVQAPLHTFSLTAGYSDYALPSDCAAIWSVRDQTNYLILKPSDIKEIERGQILTGTQPTRYARWGDYIIVDPYPAATDTGLPTMAIRFTVPITQPTLEIDTIVTYTGKTLPTKFFELLVRGTLFYAYKSLEMVQEAEVAKLDYCGQFPTGPLGGYAFFLSNGENSWKEFAWDAQMQPRFN